MTALLPWWGWALIGIGSLYTIYWLGSMFFAMIWILVTAAWSASERKKQDEVRRRRSDRHR